MGVLSRWFRIRRLLNGRETPPSMFSVCHEIVGLKPRPGSRESLRRRAARGRSPGLPIGCKTRRGRGPGPVGLKVKPVGEHAPRAWPPGWTTKVSHGDAMDCRLKCTFGAPEFQHANSPPARIRPDGAGALCEFFAAFADFQLGRVRVGADQILLRFDRPPLGDLQQIGGQLPPVGQRLA
jgi:hypothetical protein